MLDQPKTDGASRMSGCLPDDTETEKRSLRIRGRGTTIRLERPFWAALEEMAANQGVTLGEFIAGVSEACKATRRNNLSSCLRVVCLNRRGL